MHNEYMIKKNHSLMNNKLSNLGFQVELLQFNNYILSSLRIYINRRYFRTSRRLRETLYVSALKRIMYIY